MEEKGVPEGELAGGKWYFALTEGKGALLVKHQKNLGDIVVRKRIMQKGKMLNVFGLFRSMESLYNYVISLPVEERDLYEVFDKNEDRKPYFDIDVKVSGEEKFVEQKLDEIFSELKTNLEKLLNTKKNGYRMYVSHGAGKRSGHVVLTGRYHSSNVEGKDLYDKVLMKLPEHLREYVDERVYSVRQNWRLLYCGKLGSKRPKILEKSSLEGNSSEKFSFSDFCESLVCNVKRVDYTN